MASEITVQTIKGPTSGANANKVIIPSGQTLDATTASVSLPPSASNKMLQYKYSGRVGGTNMSNTSFAEISTGMRVTMTIASSTSVLDFTCPLYTEIDGTVGHGVARLDFSTDGGSNWSAIGTYNVTAALDNAIGFGFTEFYDHSFSAGQSVIFRVLYRCTGTPSNNATIADTGPGENPRAYLTVMEIAQ